MESSLLEDIELNSNDNDDADVHQDYILNWDNGREKSPRKEWDAFRVLHPDDDTDLVQDQKVYNFTIKLVKILTYLATFLIVLTGAVVTKLTTLLMTSQLQPGRRISFCNTTQPHRPFVVGTSIEERLSWAWTLYFVFILPEILTFLRGVRIWILKERHRPSMWEFLIPFLTETLHTIGMGILVFSVLPTLDSIKAAMLTNSLCLVPGILGMLSRESDGQWVRKCMDVLAVLFQLTGLFAWPVFAHGQNNSTIELGKWNPRPKYPWLLPISLICISLGWAENFVEKTSSFETIRKWAGMKQRLRATRYFSYTFISLWKMGTFLLCLVASVWLNEGRSSLAFDKFSEAFLPHYLTVNESRSTVDKVFEPSVNATYLKPPNALTETNAFSVIYILIIQIGAAYFCYIVAKFACKICLQEFSFSLPLTLSVPVTIVITLTLCGMRETDVCFWSGTDGETSVMPGYLFWTCPQGNFWENFIQHEHAWMWILWIVSQFWITFHIWIPKGIRLASTETLFTTPMYNSLLVDISLLFNRRRDEDAVDVQEQKGVAAADRQDDAELAHIRGDPTASRVSLDENTNTEQLQSQQQRGDAIPKIYACATMWHETREEMIEMLKSIFRMDADHCSRKMALKYFEYADSGYYHFETHILFDDAFQLSDPEDSESPMIINPYVRTLLGTLEEAASHVHQAFVKLKTPKMIPTPYGGRLEWVLPGRSKLIVHLKDKSKIRHKKRWSQVMYMYYLLGHKIAELPLPKSRKMTMAENTFILAMDGDIDFQPNAVELLVDLMKKNVNLGAACGRIHPVGRGPMVWYQKFEYAIGHWLQKSTEHVFGCVLCSPGCFSLFRGKCLMSDNVMAKYTTVSTEPQHYVQFDQGEDRWLCTLLLQRGYRVEYCAASDAKTHAPEGFGEFYNQRRRWVPSTMANIMDLLYNYDKVVKINRDISVFYILYQIIMMVGSILSPGTIFLMLVGAFASTFNLGQWQSFLINFIPILSFILVCFLFKSEVQLFIAQVLSTIYALAMVAVIVANELQIIEDGFLAPSSLFLLAIVLSFAIAGMTHPKEAGCLIHIFIYYITIPSMYLLLMVYSLTNLHVVSWGTREGAKVKTKQELEAEQKEFQEELKRKKRKKRFFGLLPPKSKGKTEDRDGNTEGSFELSFAGLFKVMCCVKDKPDDTKSQLNGIVDMLKRMSRKLERLERSGEFPLTRRTSSGTVGKSSVQLAGTTPGTMARLVSFEELNTTDENLEPSSDLESLPDQAELRRDDLMNPFWMEDVDLRNTKVDFLTGAEIKFWEELIEKYLKPIDADSKKEKEMAKQLKELRNKVAFAFLMINAIFVIFVFLLQLEKETINVKWPFGANITVNYLQETGIVQLQIDKLELEPIGLVFVGFFGFILIIQFIGMLLHRFGTLSHILAATEIDLITTKEKERSTKDLRRRRIGLIPEKTEPSFENDQTTDAAFMALQDNRRHKVLERNSHEATTSSLSPF